MKGFVHHNIIKSTRQVMVMSVLEIVIISAGLSLDVFVAMAYMGAGFSKINKKNLFGLCLLFGGVQWGCLIVGNLLTLLPIFRNSSNSLIGLEKTS